jgi:methylaspartate mutase sigma subunit
VKSKTIIIGTIGEDAHMIGQFIIWRSLKEAGFNAISLGACIPADEFINAAIETNADAILVSSLYGMGIFDCAELRDKCIEAGLKNIILYAGGRLTTGVMGWEEIEKRYKDMGFDRVYPPGTLPPKVIADLKADLKIEE